MGHRNGILSFYKEHTQKQMATPQQNRPIQLSVVRRQEPLQGIT